jgi:predicted nucleic acid-binding protein
VSEANLIVADTGPLIALHCADAVVVLQNLYAHVYVPPAVASELAVGDTRVGGDLLAQHSWLEVRAPTGHPDPLLLEERDAGEAEAITLAVELGRVGVLLDEHRGRRIASRVYGLEVRGTLGVPTEARRRGLLPALAPVLERLVQGGISLSPKLIEDALRAVGER